MPVKLWFAVMSLSTPSTAVSDSPFLKLSLTAGLYGERVGALSFVLSDDGAAKRVLSQLKRIARAIYSNPPVHGARIVAEVVGNEDMFTEWKEEMQGMAGRIMVSAPAWFLTLPVCEVCCVAKCLRKGHTCTFLFGGGHLGIIAGCNKTGRQSMPAT